MRKTEDILGIPVDSMTMKQALDIIKSFLAVDKVHTIFTPNAEILMAAQRDPELKKILIEADMLTADGAGVVLASKILGRSVPEKVSGVDMVRQMFSFLAADGASYFLFGSKPGTAEIAAENILKDHPYVRIAGCRNGYFTDSEEADIIKQINDSGANVLIVALGAPKQEKWISRNKDKLKTKVCMGLGGTIDILAGTVALAPEILRKNGFEWLFRLYREPWRAKRMLDLPRFIIRVICERLRIYRKA